MLPDGSLDVHADADFTASFVVKSYDRAARPVV
jgi:hypothetical protein